jgi:hypothetical protein
MKTTKLWLVLVCSAAGLGCGQAEPDARAAVSVSVAGVCNGRPDADAVTMSSALQVQGMSAVICANCHQTLNHMAPF